MSERRFANVPVSTLMSLDEFEAAIRAVGAERYHDKHTFHKLLHGGKLTKGQVQAWALNRYCYQEAVPRKDAALDQPRARPRARREWLHRVHDHDGLPPEEPGGIERWLVLTDGLGLDRAYVTSMQGALPATRFAVEAYVHFVREAAADGCDRLLAHRAVRAFDPPRAHRRHAGELRLHLRRRARLLQAAPDAGPARRHLRARVREGQRQEPRGAGGVRRRRALQVRRAVGAARRARSTPTSRGTCRPAPSAPRSNRQQAERLEETAGPGVSPAPRVFALLQIVRPQERPAGRLAARVCGARLHPAQHSMQRFSQLQLSDFGERNLRNFAH